MTAQRFYRTIDILPDASQASKRGDEKAGAMARIGLTTAAIFREESQEIGHDGAGGVW
jgi:hypothetical protein